MNARFCLSYDPKSTLNLSFFRQIAKMLPNIHNRDVIMTQYFTLPKSVNH